ncbi:MAG: DUF3987 domain-containing protein [Chitinophagaceae bacterium]|nr:DUF3987 domain-containing protein [Chitinophagaceae bacterium]
MYQSYNNRQEEEVPFILPQYQDSLRATFPENLYKHLPPLLRELFEGIDNSYERDILLLGVLTVMSGCMPNVMGYYDRKWIYPNLYTFIEAPAGSGKGVLSWARLVGMPIHKMLLEETQLARQQFEELKREKAKQKESDGQVMKEPPYKLLFIPGNNSASSVVQTLSENDGAGILFCTEADTLANSLAQDWGNFSDVLRGAFHHEPVEMQRRQNREHFSVEHPRLSVLLTGTKGQVFRLIPNTENGLFSRFMFYSFPAVPLFRNVFERNGTDPGQRFRDVGQVILEMYRYLTDKQEPMPIYYRKEQQEHFMTLYKSITEVAFKGSGTPILATVHRLGLITFRISMVLSMFRYFTHPNKQQTADIKIAKIDFDIAQEICLTLLYHANVLIADMKDGSKMIQNQVKYERLYEDLPEEFTLGMAIQISSKINLSVSSVRRYLLNGRFEKVGQGKYRKLLKKVEGEQMNNEQMNKPE